MTFEPFAFIDNVAFEYPKAAKIFGEAPLPPLPAALCCEPGDFRRASYVMTQAEEAGRFCQMNYAKKVFNSKLAASRRKKPLEFWHHRVRHLEEYLTRLNLPLVYSQVARNTRRYTFIDWDEAVSEGSMALTRAIGAFDVNVGCKFSTYGCQAILHSLSSANAKAAKRRCRLVTVEMPDTFGEEEPSLDDDNSDEIASIRHVLRANKGHLTETELLVIQFRFGLEGVERKTLEDVGKVIGVSKERVRQIQEKALSKLREVFAA